MGWYNSGTRNAEPVEVLKKAQALFLDRLSELVNASSLEKVPPFFPFGGGIGGKR